MVELALQIVVPHVDVRMIQRIEFAAFVLVLVFGAIDHAALKFQVSPRRKCQSRIVDKRVNVVTIIEREAFIVIDLIIKSVELAFLETQAPVVARIRIAGGGKRAQVAPGATGDRRFQVGAVRRIPSNDVDGAQKCVDTIGGRIRSSGNLNALDQLEGHRHGFPVHVGQGCPVSRPAVYQNLHSPLFVVDCAVVGNHGLMAANKVHYHAWHQAEDFIQASDTQVPNQVSGNHRRTAGHSGFGLPQSGGGQHFRYRGVQAGNTVLETGIESLCGAG